MVPDFFIIGHEKCGTTALYKILRQHPQIFMPALKEPRFFVVDPRTRGPAPPNPERPWTLEQYLALFVDARPGQRIGEASPQYIRVPDAPQLIAQVQPRAQIIAMLREPVSFVRTYHLQCVRGLREPERDLRKALALEEPRRQGEKLPDGRPNRMLFYRDHVRYVEQLRRFDAVFGRERILVLVYEDFLRSNDAVARSVMRFLEVDDTIELDAVKHDLTNELPRRRNGRKAVRYKYLHRGALALRRARRTPAQAGRLARTLDAFTPARLRSDAIENLARRLVFSVPPPPDGQFMSELRRQFKPEVSALSEYLGRDLVSEWGYEHVD